MEKEILYERIEAYLAGSLSNEERDRFEQQMAADPDLVAEVALHRQLELWGADKEKIAFVKKVDAIASEFPVTRVFRAGKRFIWLALILLGITAVALLWKFYSKEQSPDHQENTSSLEMQEFPASTPDTIPVQPQVPAAPTDSVSTRTPLEPKAPRRDPFALLPSLEREINQGADTYLTVETAILEAPRGASADTRAIRFFGRLLTALEVPPLELVLIDNSAPSGSMVLRIPVTATLIEDQDNIRAFAAKKAYNLEAFRTMPLGKGLYYGRLVVLPEDRAIWTGKIKVE